MRFVSIHIISFFVKRQVIYLAVPTILSYWIGLHQTVIGAHNLYDEFIFARLTLLLVNEEIKKIEAK